MNFKEYTEIVSEIKSFTDYENVVRPCAIYPNQGSNIIYPVLGLCGETGEIAEKIKKVIRDNSGAITDQTRELLILELGDVLWYLSALSMELNTTLEEIATQNARKLLSRKSRSVLSGSGDQR